MARAAKSKGSAGTDAGEGTQARYDMDLSGLLRAWEEQENAVQAAQSALDIAVAERAQILAQLVAHPLYKKLPGMGSNGASRPGKRARPARASNSVPQAAVLEYIRANPRSKIDGIARGLGCKVADISASISALKASEEIKNVGGHARGTLWKAAS